MTLVVQTANFVTPTSGGLRTALDALASGYAAAGHEVVQVLPGPRAETIDTPWGRQITVRAPEVPGTGYRLVLRAQQVVDVLEGLEPDRLEVHDRTTLRSLGGWAARRGIPSLVVSHERLDRLLTTWLSPRLPCRRLADRSNAALAAHFDAVVCTTAWAAEEFQRLGVGHLVRVPLGVDLERFSPRDPTSLNPTSLNPTSLNPTSRNPTWLSDPRTGELVLLLASRLSKEKRPELALDTLAELRHRGLRVRLVVAGDGPLRGALEQRAHGLPVTFLGFVKDRAEMAGLLGSSDVVLAPGPIETFGLAALEALACGTPVVANGLSALREVLGPGGEAVGGTPRSFADAVQRIVSRPADERRRAARARAEEFPWSATVQGFLDTHGLPALAGQAA